MEQLEQVIALSLNGMFWGALLMMGIVHLSVIRNRPKVNPERRSAIRHHCYRLCTYLCDLVIDNKISREEAETILRVALIATIRGNKSMQHPLHHIDTESPISDKNNS